MLFFGSETAELLKGLPNSGPLFPRLAQMHEKHRAKNSAGVANFWASKGCRYTRIATPGPSAPEPADTQNGLPRRRSDTIRRPSTGHMQEGAGQNPRT